jgi:hypothetical protein
MWVIRYNKGKDFIIESENNKLYKIDEDVFVNFENESNYNINYDFYWDEKFQNAFIDWISWFYNNEFIFSYKDRDFWDENIKFTYWTFIGDKYYEINSKFVENMFEDRNFESYDIDIYMVDEIKDFYYNVWKINFKLSPSVSWFLSWTPSSLSIKWEIYFDRFKFIEYIFSKYLAMSYSDWTYESFKWED